MFDLVFPVQVFLVRWSRVMFARNEEIRDELKILNQKMDKRLSGAGKGVQAW